jgi:hypothetical protein
MVPRPVLLSWDCGREGMAPIPIPPGAALRATPGVTLDALELGLWYAWRGPDRGSR